jgi:hypothetical protein
VKRALALFGLLALAACVEPLPEPAAENTAAMAVGETRTIDLRFLRFDVTGFAKTLTRADIQAFPDDVKERLWLMDLDLSNGPNTPHMLDNALAQVKSLDPATLSPAARNMQGLLRMTPATAKLDGTSLEELTRLAPLIGVAPEKCLADMLAIDVDREFLSSTAVSEAILAQVIRTHPNARRRFGPVDATHPDGLYDVAPAALPVTLGDAASDFDGLAKKFGKYDHGGVYHPGFITGTSRAKVLGEDFALTVRANANAMPYKGIDLTNGHVASVNSIPSQIERLFDFSDPNWLTIQGLVPGIPTIETITFRIEESDRFVPGGRSPLPAGYGSSPVWEVAPWSLERVIADASQRAYGTLASRIAYGPEGRPRPLFQGTVTQGWQTIEVDGGLGSPPAPSYIWDMLLEVGQVRLHDGGLAEGQASVEFTLKDVPIGVDSATLEQTIRTNLSGNARALLDIATRLVDNTEGAADFYYYRASPDNDPDKAGDWLFFVTPDDLKPNADGSLRSYASPGFFSDENLTAKVSSKVDLDGDTTHEKVQLTEGTVVYLQDENGAVFRLTAGAKTSPTHLPLTVTRVR